MTQELLFSLLAQAKEMKSQLDALRPLSPDMEKRIFDKLRLDWNYHSNHMEGNSLTYGETKMLLMYWITSNGKPLKDAIEMKWHNEALKWVLDIVYDEYPLSETFIRELNKMVLGDPYEVDAITPDGKPTKKRISPWEYKKEPNSVLTKTGEIFRFAEPFETPAKMHDLIDWFRTERQNQNLDPILFAIEFHYRFIRIHPFDDGNGRTVRILMNFILMQYGYPPAIIRTDMKEWYLAALEQADTWDLWTFFEYVTREVIRSLDVMLRWARGEEIDDEDDLDKEIRLLKGEISGGNKHKFGSKKEKIEYTLWNTITPFIQYIFWSLWDFDDFYHYPRSAFAIVNYEQTWWMNLFANIEANATGQDISGKKVEGDDIFDIQKLLIEWKAISNIFFRIRYTWLNFLKENEENSYLFCIDIDFSSESFFEIKVQDFVYGHNNMNNIFVLKKTYLENISQIERNKILNLAKQSHLEFIKSNKI